MRILFVFLAFMISSMAHASQPIRVTLEELTSQTDHVLIGRIIGVDMIDGDGKQITDLDARTGPGSKNLIRLIVKVDEVIVSNVKNVPDTLKVPLDPFMHYSLGQIKEAHSSEGEKFLLLLRKCPETILCSPQPPRACRGSAKGSDFQPPFPGVFGRSLSEKDKIIELMKSNKSKHADLGELSPTMSLECLKLVGITESSETKIAIVEDDQGKVYRLKKDDYIGENDGLIVSINVTDITIIQLVQDENGYWQEKYVTFAME